MNYQRRLEVERREPITVLVAENYQHAEWWCRNVGNRNPRDRNLVIVTSVEGLQKIRGLSLVRGYDQKVIYTYPTDPNWAEESYHVFRMIWREEL